MRLDSHVIRTHAHTARGKMQRGKKEVVKERVKQSNLDLHSDLSLSALASSNSCGSLSVRSSRNAAVLASPKTAKGGVQRLPPTSFSTSNQLGDSCSSDTDQVLIYSILLHILCVS